MRSSGTGENVPVFLCRFRVVDNGGNERVEEMEVGLSGMKVSRETCSRSEDEEETLRV